jgi:hypothetical protein
MNGYVELICKPPAEDGIVWVVKVYYVKGHVLCPGIFLASERNWQGYFSQCVDSLSFKTYQ